MMDDGACGQSHGVFKGSRRTTSVLSKLIDLDGEETKQVRDI